MHVPTAFWVVLLADLVISVFSKVMLIAAPNPPKPSPKLVLVVDLFIAIAFLCWVIEIIFTRGVF
ncbi:hypothetical protein ACQUFY_06445 [Robbsia andropogonis]|uniref:hypothetical protein n=1 Tax=Robbsia andropogonis TaxID=28092 RepID=UPI003D20F778